MGLFDNLIEPEEDPVNKDVSNEGNIPQQDPENSESQNKNNIQPEESQPEGPTTEGNIQPKQSQPESPTKEGNIDPQETDTEQTERDSIPVSENAPNPPQRSGNIQPSEFDPEDQPESEISPDEDRPVDAPQRRRNIRPDEENRPDNPNRIPFQSKEDAKPDRLSEPQIEADEKNKPQNARTRGNIEPTEEPPAAEPMDESDLEVSASEQENVESEGNISPREENAPTSPNREENISESEKEIESPSNEGNITPDPENRPLGPQFSGNIQSDEENKPESPNTKGSITPDEESKPSGPSTEGNVTPTEESEPSSPNRQENISPDEDSSPSSPSTEGNIKSEENQPSNFSQTGNITPNEDATPESPSRAGNISPREQNTPASPNRGGSIDPRENQPEAPNREGNVTPNEESRPESPSRENNIEADKKKPETPKLEDNINEKDRRPEGPRLEQNINPTDGENTDGVAGEALEQPRREGNIDPSDKSVTDQTGTDPLEQPQREGNIDPSDKSVTDNTGSDPLEQPQREGNIDPSDKSVTDNTGTDPLEQPQKEGNIDPSDKSVTDQTGTDPLEQPQREGNIDPQDETTTDGIAGQEIDREQPLKFQPESYASQIDPETAEFTDDVAAEFIGSADGIGEWQVPLRHQPSDLYSNQINPQSEQFRDGLGSEFIGETDGSEWEVPLRHQPQSYADQINPQDASVTDGIGGNEPGEVLQNQPFRQTDVDEDAQSPKQNRYQPKGLEASPYLGQEYTDTDGSAIFTGSDNGAAEWEVPLRYQPSDYLNQIDPKSQEFRDGIGEVFTGEGDGSVEWEVPLRYQPTRFANQISPDHEGGLYSSQSFVAGSNEPGDNVRNMGYSFDGANAPLRFQPDEIVSKLRGGTIINPDDEGGRYQLEQFVAGSNEPEENIRNMEYDKSGATEDLRHQPEEVIAKLRDSTIINPDDEGGRYQLERFVAGSDEPGGDIRDMEYSVKGATAKLRHQTAVKFALSNNVIDPSFEGGRYISERFVTGSNEPGDDIRNMEYTVEGVSEPARHVKTFYESALENYIIDPSFEGGLYLSPKFVAGSNEPGDNIRNMKYTVEGVSQTPRHVKTFYEFALANYIIDPSFEGGAYLSPKFVAGSNEPGDNIRDMEYSFEAANEELRHQQAVKSALSNGTIDPSFEGGNYLVSEYVLGSDEPGDQLPDFQSAAFGDESSDPSNDMGPVIIPSDNTGETKENELVIQNQRVSEIVIGSEPGETLPRFQPSPFNVESNHPSNDMGPVLSNSFGADKQSEFEIQNQLVSDLAIGNEPGAQLPEFQTSAFNLESDGVLIQNSKAQKEQEFEKQNKTIRLSEFASRFDAGRNDLTPPDSPIPRLRGNVGPATEPFILRKPEAGGGSAVLANIKQADSRTVPLASSVEDATRITKFFGTGKGLLYNTKQALLQKKNPRKRTRLYNPTAPIEASASGGQSIRPGQQITRHLDASSGPLGLVGSAASSLGIDVPKSSKYEDEISEEAVSTGADWGEMTGSLFWLSPVATDRLPSNSNPTSEVSSRFKSQLENVKPLHSMKENESLSESLVGSVLNMGGGPQNQKQEGSGYLFTGTYDTGKGRPEDAKTYETDNYHPESKFIENLAIHNSDDGLLDFGKTQFNGEYVNLRKSVEKKVSDAPEYFPYANFEASPPDEDIGPPTEKDFSNDVYYQGQAFEGNRIPIQRGVTDNEESRGLPNYSLENEDGERQKRIDWINRLEPIVGKDADPEQESYGGDGRHKDFIPFKFYDIENEGVLVFRAILEGISDSLSPEWSQQDYAGRPEQGHKYSGYSNTISFSFQAMPTSREEFKAIWKKINYLKGLTTPASYSAPSGGGGYMTPPFMRLTIGDMFNDVYGYMNSLTISVNDDAPWEIDEDLGRLPRGLEVDVDWQVIQKRAPRALQKFYDAPFIEKMEDPFKETPEDRAPVELPTSDVDSSEYTERDRRKSFRGNAIELAKEEP